MRIFVRLLTYVRRTIWRAKTRSFLTIVGTALALALFGVVHTLEAGVSRLAKSSEVPVLVVFQSSRFCPLTSQLPMRYASDIARLEGVESVLPTLLHINSCRTNLDVVTLHGVPPADVDTVHDMRLVEGDLTSWRTQSDGAVVGRRLAERRGLGIGDRLRLGNVDVEVGGIITSPGGGLDNFAFVHLDTLQLARKRQGQATEFLVKLAPGADAQAVARRIDERFGSDEQPTDTKSMQAFVQGAVQEVSEVVEFARFLGYLAVLVVTLILGNTVWISAHTRVAEFGVLQTLGATRPLVAGLVVVEGIALALVGGLLGTAAVFVGLQANPVTIGVEGFGIDLIPDAGLFAIGLAVSALVGAVASIGPAIDVMRRPLALSVKPA